VYNSIPLSIFKVEPMLIALAGLPATGKSALAICLAKEFHGVILSKDQVRAALFPPRVLDYSAAENDISMAAIFQAAAYIRTAFPRQPIILDGRTFLRSRQLDDLFALAAALAETPHLIECVCSDEVARQRLEGDQAAGRHPAGNRTADLYRALQEQAEPIAVPHLVIDTSSASLEECVQRCLDYLRAEKP
jgi:adenylylsulfate kinase